MSDIIAWIMLNRLLAAGIGVLLIFLSFVILYFTNKKIREAVNFWILNIKPIKIDRGSMNLNGKWRQCERNLCVEYYKFYPKLIDTNYYKKCVSYLEKMGEQGRSTTPIFIWIVILGLVVAEALGFAYVLAGYTIPGASESLQQKGAIGIAFVISALLVYLTHETGGEIYKNSVLGRIREAWSNAGTLKRDQNVSIGKNYEDDDEPSWQQMFNRFSGTNAKKWYISIVTAIFIVIVAIGATYVRGQVLEKQLIQEISSATTNVYESAPAELGELQANADDKAFKEQQDADRKGGWATFIVLAVLFVFIQILGILFGFKWGFAGKESKKAYEITHKFNSVEDYEDYYSRKRHLVESKADVKLTKMQNKIYNLNLKQGNTDIDAGRDSERTFANFVKEEEDKKNKKKIEDEIAKEKKELEKISILNEAKRQHEQQETKANIEHEAIKQAQTAQNSEISSTNSATQNIQPQDLAQTDTKDDLSANKNTAESANRIAQLNKTIAKLEENKANLLKNGADEFDNEILDIDSKIDKAKEKLKGLENA